MGDKKSWIAFLAETLVLIEGLVSDVCRMYF
jgi:hypothetical protein